MKPRLFALAASAALVAVSSFAHAHSLLINPKPLTTDDNAKAGPCGCYFGGGPEDPNEDGTATACPATYTVTELVAGSTIQVAWKETVQHNGKFRLAISSKPIDTVTRADMNNSVVYEADDKNTQSGGLITTMLVVPEMSCENCVLQLRQFMDGATKPYYYSCAAITITDPSGAASSTSASSSSTTGAGGSGAGGGGMGGSGAGEVDSVGPGPAPVPEPTASSACSVSTDARSGDALGIAALAILGLVARRRRQS